MSEQPFSIGNPNLSPLVAYGIGIGGLALGGVVAGYVLAPYYDVKRSTTIAVSAGIAGAFGALLTAVARAGKPVAVATQGFDAWPIDLEHYGQGMAPGGSRSFPGATAGWYDGSPLPIDVPPGTTPEVIEAVMNQRYRHGWP